MTPLAMCFLMFVCSCGLLLLGFPVAFTLAGVSAAFAYFGYMLGMFDVSLLTAFPQRIFAIMSNDVLVAVPLFVFMGVTLERSKIAEELLDNMGRLFGRIPGGLAFSVSVVGMLLAASTGIVGATVVTMGLLSLPTMIRRGYDVSFACGSIAASGTLGQIIPPSIVLVLLGDQLSIAFQNAQFSQGIFAPDTVSVNDLFAGALFPGLFLVGLYLLYQAIYAMIWPQFAPPVTDGPLPAQHLRMPNGEAPHVSYGQLLAALCAPLMLIIAVLGSILAGLATPTEAASVGAVGAILLAGLRAQLRARLLILLAMASLFALLVLSLTFDLRMQRDQLLPADQVAIGIALSLTAVLTAGIGKALLAVYRKRDDDGGSVLFAVMRSTVMISSMVFVIFIGASMFSLVFRGFGGDIWIENFLHNLPGGTVAAILLVMVVMFLLGFFLDFLEIVFIVVPIVAPILLQMEVAEGVLMSPVWLGVMMAINLQTSFLTPPFGFALFYLRGVAPAEVKTIAIYRGVVPFIVIQLLALVALSFFPGLATWLPDQLYGP